MPRSIASRHQRDAVALHPDLTGIAVELALIRIDRVLARKDWSDQPRAPAGQPDGGRWVPDGSGGPGASPASRTEAVVTEDGSHVLSIRIRADRHAVWDEQHTVTAPDGTRTVFETSGFTQTIRDGETGGILGRSMLAADGSVPEAFVQPARSLPGELARQAARTLEAAASLFAALSGRNGAGRTAVFAAPASEYVPGDAYDERAVWVGAVGQSELDRLCPRNREVHAIADAVAAEVRASGNYMDARDSGNKVHARIAGIVRSRNDPTLIAETSYDPVTGGPLRYSTRGSLRLDLLEDARPSTVCVYDHKTRGANLRSTRAVDIMSVIQKHFRGTMRYIMIEIIPKS